MLEKDNELTKYKEENIKLQDIIEKKDINIQIITNELNNLKDENLKHQNEMSSIKENYIKLEKENSENIFLIKQLEKINKIYEEKLDEIEKGLENIKNSIPNLISNIEEINKILKEIYSQKDLLTKQFINKYKAYKIGIHKMKEKIESNHNKIIEIKKNKLMN